MHQFSASSQQALQAFQCIDWAQGRLLNQTTFFTSITEFVVNWIFLSIILFNKCVFFFESFAAQNNNRQQLLSINAKATYSFHELFFYCAQNLKTFTLLTKEEINFVPNVKECKQIFCQCLNAFCFLSMYSAISKLLHGCLPYAKIKSTATYYKF